MRFQIISSDNGVGLTHDVEVLRSALHQIGGGGYTIDYRDWQHPIKVENDHYDFNIFLELLNPFFFRQAKKNILVPNPEWFLNEWRPLLPRLHTVWAKTRDSFNIFKSLHTPVVYLGWTSIDAYDEQIQPVDRKKAMLHVAGKSSAKGTDQVLKAMAMMPHYALTMITNQPRSGVPRNVGVLDRQSAEALRRLQNTHRIHLCPSSAEGFGHYINEARSVGAVVITTNAPPMNELITPNIGMGASVDRVSNQCLVQHKHVSVEGLAGCIDIIMRASDAALATVGARAREAYLAGRDEFFTNLKALIQ